MRETINFYENFLLETRGWISKWPKKAVFIYSGGMDSTISMAKLLEEKKIELFPLFINRGQTNLEYERQSAFFHTEYLQKRYGKLLHDLFEIEVNVPPNEIKSYLKTYTEKHGHPLRNTILQMIGVQYGISLLAKNETIKTVFCAQMPDDPFPHSTLISLRSNTINICESLSEWDWQITSPNIDPILTEQPLDKIQSIKWADSHDISIGNTRSCYTSGPKHCGVCLTCKRRKEAFQKAGVKDTTEYSY